MQTQALKGRGASSNPSNRFHSIHSVKELPNESEMFDEGNHGIKLISTEIIEQTAKTVIARNQSPDVPHEQSVNPYAGCEHGCVYCYARPSHAYHDLSPGLDFETKIIAKTNADECLRQEISKPAYKPKPILIGANTDPYQPVESRYQLTRKLLEVCLEKGQPVSLITKSHLIERDLDLLEALAQKGLCSVRVSVTTLDNELKRILEPRTASGSARLAAIHKLATAGVPTGVIVAPVIPSINDKELEAILKASKDAGASSATYILLRLPHEVKDLFSEWLEIHYPQRAKHVLSLISQCRGGKLYDSNYKNRMTGEGVFAEMISTRFSVACNRLGLKMVANEKLNLSLFKAAQGAHPQMCLF